MVQHTVLDQSVILIKHNQLLTFLMLSYQKHKQSIGMCT